MKKTRHQWTAAEKEVLHQRYPNERTAIIARDLGLTVHQIYAMAALLGIKKSAEFYALPVSGRTTGRHGMGTRFQKGHTTWNKGMKGLDIGGRETRFKSGVRQGVAIKLYQPVGTYRITEDGYLQQKINDDFPAHRRWKAVHRMVWEAEHGPIPEGHIVRFKPGMKTSILEEITPAKLEMLSLRENMQRNSYHNNYPKEIGKLIQLRGAVQRKINDLEKKNDGRK